MNTRARPLFFTITSADWARSIASARSQTNEALHQIREKLSQLGTGRACVPLELARVNEPLVVAQARSNSSSMSLDGSLPCESGEKGTKTACTKLELRAEDITSTVTGSATHERSAAQRAEAGDGGTKLSEEGNALIDANQPALVETWIETPRILPVAVVGRNL